MLRIFFILTFIIFTVNISSVMAATATAIIKGTAENSSISGTATLTEAEEGGVNIAVSLTNVTPGKHAFHIHEKGDCSEMGNAAGSHYNPHNVPHGLVTKDGLAAAHPGDLGNIEITEDGSGSLTAFVPGLALSGDDYNVMGRSVILHENPDDFSQPTGNAGGRIACGVIVLTGAPHAQQMQDSF